MKTLNAQSTVEYVLFAGVLVLAVMTMLNKSVMSKRIAQIYDDSGSVMSRNAGRSNSGEVMVEVIDSDEEWTLIQKIKAGDISMHGVYTWDQCVERCRDHYGSRPRDYRKCVSGRSPLCNIYPRT